jgi:hypothetical protein
MDTQQLQQKLRTALGLRVGDHTARYILARLAAPKPTPFPILANHALTGQPLNRTLNPADLRPDDSQPTLF